VPVPAPSCGAGDLKPQGQGTERLEEALVAQFPQVPVLRVDRETTRRRDAFEQLLATLQDDQPAILVGTQMLAKGHDLPNLTLVAIVGVDEGLHSVDFRAGERLAQLVVQVAGRAGRARKPGRVLLQTHQPEHPLLRGLLAHGYAAAARELLAERRQIQLPPYSHQVLLRADAPHASRRCLSRCRARCATRQHRVADRRSDARTDAAARRPPSRSAAAGSSQPQRAARHAASWQNSVTALPQARPVRWSLDVDPIDLY
jgi:primosomal protein N' (replication factor Y)